MFNAFKRGGYCGNFFPCLPDGLCVYLYGGFSALNVFRPDSVSYGPQGNDDGNNNPRYLEHRSLRYLTFNLANQIFPALRFAFMGGHLGVLYIALAIYFHYEEPA